MSWKLQQGLHRGTITSRDGGEYTTNRDGTPLQSLEECKAVARENAMAWASYGATSWYATAVSPEGERIRIPEFCDSNYRS